MYRDELADFLAEEFDVYASEVTISRVLEQEKISRKKVLKVQ